MHNAHDIKIFDNYMKNQVCAAAARNMPKYVIEWSQPNKDFIKKKTSLYIFRIERKNIL